MCNRNSVVAIVVAFGAFGVCTDRLASYSAREIPVGQHAEPDFSKLPVLKGKVVQVIGHLGTYIQPGAEEIKPSLE